MDDVVGRRPVRRVLAILIALCCVACWMALPPDEGPDQTPETGGTAGRVPSPTGGEGATLPTTYEEAVVVDVIDGDTIKVRVAGEVHTVRYIGIDAPERREALGPAATETNRALVADRTVALEKDVSETDEYGRWLRYVFRLDGLFVNGEMVRLGMARAQAYPPDVSRQARLAEWEEEARAAGRGLWEPLGTPAAPGAAELRIVAVDKEAEVVFLTNEGARAQDLSGWTLVSERGEQVCHLAGTLAPGASLSVWAQADDADRGGYTCGFDEPIWNNNEPDEAVLYDAMGQLVDVFP